MATEIANFEVPPINREKAKRQLEREASPNPRTRARAVNLNAHPLIVELGRLMDAKGIGRKPMARMAGLAEKTVPDWFRNNARPYLPSVESVANSLGYRIALRKAGALRSDLIGTKGLGGPPRHVNPETHWLVVEWLRLADKFAIGLRAACRASGVNLATLKAWWSRGNQPSVDRIGALYAVFGLELCIVPLDEREQMAA